MKTQGEIEGYLTGHAKGPNFGRRPARRSGVNNAGRDTSDLFLSVACILTSVLPDSHGITARRLPEVI